MSTIKRIPRPLGSTELSLTFYNTKDNDVYNSLQGNIINHWVRNNFMYCGVYMNIESFSRYTKIKELDIKKGIGDYMKGLKGISDELGQGNMMRALQNLTLGWVLEDRSLAVQQYSILAKQQQNEYVPFLSAEVGRAIKLVLDSSNNAMNMIKAFGSGIGTVMPFEDNQEAVQERVTVDKVVMMLKENNVPPLLEDQAYQERLYLEHNLEDMPEIDARKQTGIDTSREGLGIMDITKLQKFEEEEEIEDKVTKHQNRRARQIGKDLEDI